MFEVGFIKIHLSIVMVFDVYFVDCFEFFFEFLIFFSGGCHRQRLKGRNSRVFRGNCWCVEAAINS